MAEPLDEGSQRQNETQTLRTQTYPGPSTSPTNQEALTQQLPADGVRDAQQTTQSGSRQPSQQEPMPQPPSQVRPRPERKLDVEPPHASDNVMKALEADASERAEKRKAEATVLKDQGNQAFQKGDYTRAVELYTQGMEHLKDFVVLYTNRAQAYNKLEKFTEAMEDCRTALQLEPNNVKALVHLGKAQQGLKDYRVAVMTFQEILKIDKKYENMVADYIAAVNNAESTAKSDKEAERSFTEGDDKATGVQKMGITEPVLRKISKRLGSEWQGLATHLGLSAAEIKHIMLDDQGQTENQIFNMLVKWHRNLSTSADQRKVLCTALMEIGRRDIVEDLIEITELQGPVTFEDLQQEIIDNYKQTATTIPAHPTLQTRQVGIEEFFVPLHLIKNIPGKTKSGRSVRLPEGKLFLDEALYDILNSLDDLFNQEIVKEIKILLVGGAGMGKSTVLVKIANSSITPRSKHLLGRFDLVLWIKLRQMQQSSCVLDAIFDQLLAQNTKLTKPIVKGFIDHHESRTALLLDGVDEIPSHVLQSKEGVYRVQDILHNKVLTKSFVLVTTRPHMKQYILGGHPKYAEVETFGFNPQDRDKYIRLNLSDDANMGEALISYLKVNENLQDMSAVPIISQMLCLVWKNQKSLPERITKLFAKFTKVLFLRRNEGMGDQHMMSTMMSIIDDLGRVALQGLLDSRGERLMFDETEFQNCQSSLTEGCHVGFVQRETFTCGLDVKVLVTFPHKTIQEYFAACHLVKLLKDDKNKFRDQLKQIGEHNVLAMEYLLRFCCGKSGQAAGLILDHIKNVKSERIDFDKNPQILARWLLLESRSGELAAKLVRPTVVYCNCYEDLKSLNFYLKHVTPPLKRTYFYMDVRQRELTFLKEILQSDSIESAYRVVVNYHLSEQQQGGKELNLLEKTLGVVDEQRRALLDVTIHIVRESWFDLGPISHSFFRMQKQTGSLSLSMVTRSPDEFFDLLNALEGCRLNSLTLWDIDLHARLRNASHIPSNLVSLNLSGCRLVDDDVKDLMRILPAGPGLSMLVLDNNAFSSNAVSALTNHLRQLHNMRLLPSADESGGLRRSRGLPTSEGLLLSWGVALSDV